MIESRNRIDPEDKRYVIDCLIFVTISTYQIVVNETESTACSRVLHITFIGYFVQIFG